MDSALLEWCKRLIATPSISIEGTRRIAELCARELLAPAGIGARLFASKLDGEEQVNLLAVVPGSDSAATPLVLNTHLDTVPPGDRSLWTECGGDPFAATIVGDRIYGLGAADTKLDFVAKATALAHCRRPKRSVYLVGTFGEERGLRGAKEMAESGLLPRRALAFVGEPSGLRLVTAHKGLMVFELEVRFEPLRPTERVTAATHAVFVGRATHSSTPALGQNAIRAALAALAARPDLKALALSGGDAVNKVPARCEVIVAGELSGSVPGAAEIEKVSTDRGSFIPGQALTALYRFAEALQQFADRTGTAEPDFAPPTLTCNAGVLRSSPNTLTLEFELRPPPGLPLDSVRSGVERIAAEAFRSAGDVEPALVEKRANAGFRSRLDGETVECAMATMARAGLPLETNVKAGCTEAGVYAAAGLEPVVFGPGPSAGVIHAPNEYNLLSEVEGALRFYRELLKR